MTPAQRTANRAAQRRLARDLQAGRPTLPKRLAGPVRKAQRRAAIDNADTWEQAIGSKPLIAFGNDTMTFGTLHSYSSATVRFMHGHMSHGERESALEIDAQEYRQLARGQGEMNVYWYHSQNEEWMQANAPADNR
jgi:hypothetical protein